MRPSSALAAAAAILLTAPARAGGPLEAAELRRVQCLIQRAQLNGPGPADPCGSLSSAERAYMDARRDEFCSRPEAFCRTMTSRDASVADQRTRLFTSPRCEMMLPRCQEISSRYRPHDGFLECLRQPDSGEDIHDGDRRFTEMMARAWGCEAAEIGVRTGPRGPEVYSTRSCDPAKVPFDCGSGRARTVAGTGESYRDRLLRESRGRIAQRALEASGARLRRSGERCLLEAPDHPEDRMMVVSHLPDVRRGETYEAYSARLTTERQRAELRERTALARRASGRALRSSADLIPHAPSSFAMVTRGILTEERLREAENGYAVARRAVVDYLRSLDPPAPRAVLAAVEGTRLADLRAFHRSPPSAQDRETMRHVEESCSGGLAGGFGKDNACNHTDPRRGAVVTICPGMLLSDDFRNPRFLLSVLAHELGHTIDPCRLQMDRNPKVRECYGAPPLAPATGDEAREAAWNARVEGPGGWISCMTTPRAPATHTGVTLGNADYSARVFEAIQRDGPRCLEVPAEMGCAIRNDLIRGPLRHCIMNPAQLLVDEERCPNSHPLTVRAPGGVAAANAEISTVAEAFSDLIASRALPRALELIEPRLGTMAQPERAAEILTTMPFYCEGSGWGDTHPGGAARAGIFASSPELRAAIGCPRATEPTRDLPTPHCTNAFDGPPRAPAAVPTPGASAAPSRASRKNGRTGG